MKLTRLVTLLLLFASGCASTSATRPQARLKDSAPEKIAAQRAAAPGLNLQQEDQRWGIDAAQERRREKQDSKASAGDQTNVGPNGPADVHQSAPPRPAP